MGTYDTLQDSKNRISCQIKIFSKSFRTYKIGDLLPTRNNGFPLNFTVILPDWEECRFVIIRDGKLYKLTDNEKEVISPIYDKWGGLVSQLTQEKFNPSKRFHSVEIKNERK